MVTNSTTFDMPVPRIESSMAFSNKMDSSRSTPIYLILILLLNGYMGIEPSPDSPQR